MSLLEHLGPASIINEEKSLLAATFYNESKTIIIIIVVYFLAAKNVEHSPVFVTRLRHLEQALVNPVTRIVIPIRSDGT